MAQPLLNEYGPAWRALDPIPDVGQWAIASARTDAPRTLANMAYLVNRAVRNRTVVELALALASQVPERDYLGQLSLIRQFVTRHFKFVRDPDHVEMLRVPEYLLQRIQKNGMVQGDCDDAAILVATLGKSIGFPAEFHAVSFRPGGRPYSHVFAVLRMPNGRPEEFDVTRPARFKLYPPPITGRIMRRV